MKYERIDLSLARSGESEEGALFWRAQGGDRGLHRL